MSVFKNLFNTFHMQEQEAMSALRSILDREKQACVT